MDRAAILYPMFIMIIMTLVVVYHQFFITKKLVRSKVIRLSYFKLFKAEYDIPNELEAVRMQYRNMFEVPLLFYVLSLFLYFSNNVLAIDLILAWCFVGGRFAHFLIRIFHYDDVLIRFNCFAFSVIAITVHWLLVIVRFW